MSDVLIETFARDSLKDPIRACFMGVAIGDALGMPVEMMKHEEIMALNGGMGVLGFQDPAPDHVFFGKKLRAGQTTDDTQLTRAVARSLIRTRGVFDLGCCAEEHVVEFDKAIGWGKTTRDSIAAIKSGERNPTVPWLHDLKSKGCGNGVAMKIAPLAAANFLRDDSFGQLKKDTLLLGGLTHPNPLAITSAYALACGFIALWKRPVRNPVDVKRWSDFVFKCSDEFERDLFGPSVMGTFTKQHLVWVPEFLSTPDSLRVRIGCSCYAPESVAFSIGTFMRHPTDFRAAVLEAVNAGGDTDSNASMVAALVGANMGTTAIPEEWATFSREFSVEMPQLADKLFDVCYREI